MSDPEVLGKKLRDLCNSSTSDLSEVEQLIAKGALVDFDPDDIGTPLFLAAEKGNEQVVELLLKNKANVNYKTKSYGWSPLHTAVQSNHEKVVHLLLKYGADPHLRKKNGATPFIVAAIVGEVNLLKVFLSLDTDVNDADDNGFTAFMEAAEHDNEDALRFLFSCKADVNKRREVPDTKANVGRGGKTALMSAVENGYENIVNILLDEMNADVNVLDNLGRTALIFALKENRRTIVETLLKHGANVNSIDKNKETPLSTALKNKTLDSDVVEMLLKHEPDVNVPDQAGKTPLILAISNGFTKVAKLLLQNYSVNINARDESGSTALLAAANSKNTELTKKLCEMGADMHSCDNTGTTPIMMAKRRYAKEIIEILNKYDLKTTNQNVEVSSNWKKCSKRWHGELEKLQNVDCNPIGNLRLSRIEDYKITRENMTEVYLGFHNRHTEVAVKCHKRHSEEALKERQCLMEPKIKASSLFVKFVSHEYDDYCEYLCLDLCEYNLEEYVQKEPEGCQSGAPGVMKQLIEGLQILHTVKIAHRDLHPTNILRDIENRVLLADFDKSVHFDNNSPVELSSQGTWEASEILQKMKQTPNSTFEAHELFAADLQALGRLLHYIVTGGKDPYECEENVCENKPYLDEKLYKSENAEVRDFIEGLLAPAETRITLLEAEQHPFLWNELEKSTFVQDLANEEVVTKRKQDSELVRILNKTSKDQHKSFHKWTEKIDHEVLENMNLGQKKKPSKKPGKAYEDTTNDLLKFIRNLTQHFNEKDPSIQKTVGKPEKYWLRLFPDFVISIYNAVKDTEWRKHFPKNQRQL
ncbi:2-5A-dependent ribonuclease-like [Hemitrygon akajei]|uniref:2-5A-dependent ribonuclease-like n=1 Tax=Hemitrygon akajei TaxID=2704970 RepID=UPI003BFA171B